MIKDIVTSLPLTLSSPHMTKNSTPSSKSSHSFHVYMLSKDCIYSGGGYGAAHGLFAGAVGGAAAVPARRRGPARRLGAHCPALRHPYL